MQELSSDAPSGLEEFRGLRHSGPARARAVTSQLPAAVLSCIVDLLGHRDLAVVASVLRAMEGRVPPGVLVARVASLLGTAMP